MVLSRHSKVARAMTAARHSGQTVMDAGLPISVPCERCDKAWLSWHIAAVDNRDSQEPGLFNPSVRQTNQWTRQSALIFPSS